MIKVFLLFISIVTLASCNSNKSRTADVLGNSDSIKTFPSNPVKFGDADCCGTDVKLSFTKATIGDSSTVYLVNSTSENGNIGLEISVPKNNLATLTIRSTGVNSNNFIHLLQRLYKQKIDLKTSFIDSINVDCIDLSVLNKEGEGELILAAQKKLFFQGAKDDDYAELFLNVNQTEHWIEFAEKDEDYRPVLIKLLTKK
jgi:hypothetical protein